MAQASGSVLGSEVEAAEAEWVEDLARQDAATDIHQHDLEVEKEAERIFQLGQEEERRREAAAAAAFTAAAAASSPILQQWPTSEQLQELGRANPILNAEEILGQFLGPNLQMPSAAQLQALSRQYTENLSNEEFTKTQT